MWDTLKIEQLSFIKVTLLCCAQSFNCVLLTLFDPMDCSPPGSSVLGIFLVRILELQFLLQGIFPTLQYIFFKGQSGFFFFFSFSDFVSSVKVFTQTRKAVTDKKNGGLFLFLIVSLFLDLKGFEIPPGIQMTLSLIQHGPTCQLQIIIVF